MSRASAERERETFTWDWRCRAARWLILFAIRVVLPAGRSRRELNELLWVWSIRVHATVAANQARQRDESGR